MANELARQGFHFAANMVMILLALVLEQQWFLLVTAALMLVGAVGVYVQPRFVKHLVLLFDRPDATFTGKGAFMAVLGGFLTALLFPAQLVPALAVLGVSDALATLMGGWFGRWRVPWSARKTWTGIAVFFFSAAAVLFLLQSPWLLAAACATVVEAGDYREFAFLDDNTLIPLTVAAALVV